MHLMELRQLPPTRKYLNVFKVISKLTLLLMNFRTNQVVSPFDDKVMGNPIGWLQEMCMSRRWPPPFYDMEHEEGLPHERQFTIACHVLKFREVGNGKSKKLAKRMAAHKMWQALQDLPADESAAGEVADDAEVS